MQILNVIAKKLCFKNKSEYEINAVTYLQTILHLKKIEHK